MTQDPNAATSAATYTAIRSRSTATIAPANGTHLVKLAKFEPSINPESGSVEQWKFTLEAAESIPDNQQPPEQIAEGSYLGTFSIFVSPSQYRSLDACCNETKIIVQALNGIVRDPRNDRGYKNADAAFAALPEDKIHPAYDDNNFLDHEMQWYEQWVGTLVLATLSTKVGKDGVERTNLTAILSKDTPRKRK